MMKAGILISLMISIINFSCTPKKSPMEGAWQLTSWQNFAGESLIWEYPGKFTGSEMKIWSKDHFAFAGWYKRDSTNIDNCGGGSYTLVGNHYEENIMYFPDQNLVGTKIRLSIEIKNDTLTQTWPLDENWQLVKENYNVQKMIRLD